MVSTRSGILGLFILLVASLTLASCGGNATYSPTVSGATGTTTPITLTISPNPAYCNSGSSVNLTAAVTGTTATQVTWSILDEGQGSIVSTGADTATYSAVANTASERKVTAGIKSRVHPSGETNQTGPVTIQAVLTSDKSITATATVIVQGVTLTISPNPAYCVPGSSVNLSATVTGTTSTQVTWSILNGGEGSIVSTGADTATYSAPADDSIKRKGTAGSKSRVHRSGETNQTGPVTIQAVLNSNKSITATATVNVQDIVITIAPSAPTVIEGKTVQFTAVVTLGGVKIANQTVNWLTDGGSPGTIDQNTGIFTAAYKPGETNVLCYSAAENGIDAYAEPNTVPPSGIAVTVNPTSKTILTGTSITPTATVTGVPAAGQAVTWSLTDSSYYGSFNSTTGTYTAPGSFPSGVTSATVHIEATSVADPTKTAICTVTIING